MQFDAMSGIPRKESTTVTATEIDFMELWSITSIRVTAEPSYLPEFGMDSVKLTISAKVGDTELTRILYAPPADDHLVLLFQLFLAPSDHFVSNVMTPFVAEVCEALGRPMIRIVKPV